jgi:predicted GNAT family N-acyltransferase
VSDERLRDAIETSDIDFPEIPGQIMHLKIPGVKGYYSPSPSAALNRVGGARLNADQVDGVIARVRDFFTKRRSGFTWVVGSSTTPTDLGERLLAAGLTRDAESAGMALTDLTRPIPSTSSVQVREVSDDAYRAASGMIARAFDLTVQVVEKLIDSQLIIRDRIEQHHYLAYLDTGQPIAYGSIMYLPALPVALLGGAATLKEHRGKGIYTTLLAKRIARAYSDDREAAVVQADRATSAPICAKYGFRELCHLTAYTYPAE